MEDGHKPSFLPWAPGQPNGAETENGVDVRLDFRNSTLPLFYYDQGSHYGQEKFICASCSLAEHFSLTLKGVCEYTLMGEYNYFLFCSSFLTSLDTIYVVQNANDHVLFSGWTSSSIRYDMRSEAKDILLLCALNVFTPIDLDFL